MTRESEDLPEVLVKTNRGQIFLMQLILDSQGYPGSHKQVIRVFLCLLAGDDSWPPANALGIIPSHPVRKRQFAGA